MDFIMFAHTCGRNVVIKFMKKNGELRTIEAAPFVVYAGVPSGVGKPTPETNVLFWNIQEAKPASCIIDNIISINGLPVEAYL